MLFTRYRFTPSFSIYFFAPFSIKLSFKPTPYSPPEITYPFDELELSEGVEESFVGCYNSGLQIVGKGHICGIICRDVVLFAIDEDPGKEAGERVKIDAQTGEALHRLKCIVHIDPCPPFCHGKAVCHLELKKRRSMEGGQIKSGLLRPFFRAGPKSFGLHRKVAVRLSMLLR